MCVCVCVCKTGDKELLSGMTLCFLLFSLFFLFSQGGDKEVVSGEEKLSQVRGQGLAGSVRGSLHAILHAVLQAHY
jgi:hypothetical protein